VGREQSRDIPDRFPKVLEHFGCGCAALSFFAVYRYLVSVSPRLVRRRTTRNIFFEQPGAAEIAPHRARSAAKRVESVIGVG